MQLYELDLSKSSPFQEKCLLEMNSPVIQCFYIQAEPEFGSDYHDTWVTLL